MEHGIVTPHLIEGSLGDGHLWRLAFQQQQRKPLGIEHQRIGPLSPSVQLQTMFNGDAAGRIAEVMDQVIQEMLAHPFLRGCNNPFAAQGVEEEDGARLLLKFDPVVW